MNVATQLIILGGVSSASGSTPGGPANGALDFTSASQSGLFAVVFF